MWAWWTILLCRLRPPTLATVADTTAYVVTIQTHRGSYRAVIHDPVMVQKAWGER